MSPRARPLLAVVLLAAASCHTAMMRIERSGSAAIADASNVEYLDFFDGRYIPLPATPFANCFDLVAPHLPRNTCDQSLPGTRYRGYAARLVPRPTTGTPPWWLRDNRVSDLFAQLAEIGRAYGGSTSAAAAGGTSWTWIGRSTDAADPRAGRVTVEAELHAAPEGVADGDLLWLTSPRTGDPTRPWVYAGAVEERTGTTRVMIPAPDTEVEDHLGTLGIAGRLPRPVLSFIHASDAQIREPAAKLGGQLVSDTLDPLIPTFAHDYEQELFSAFFYESMIRTVNRERAAALADRTTDADASYEACVRAGDRARDCALEQRLAVALARHYRVPPELMIHTGDSVDAGLLSEFEEFRSRSDLLTIPWFSVVGNHDVLGIGNLKLAPEEDAWMEQQQVGGRADVACTPVTRMLREYFLERPTQNGERGEKQALARLRSKDEFSFAPIALRAVCLDLDVEDTRGVPSDRLVGDLRRRTRGQTFAASRDAWSATATSRYVEAHCRYGGNDDWTVDRALDECARHLRPPSGACGVGGDTPNYPPRWGDERTGRGPAESRTGECSVLNGFDTEAPVTVTRPGFRPRLAWPGYYAFPIKDVTFTGQAPRAVWMIAINTSSEEGAYGAIGGADGPQMVWLRAKLKEIHDANGIAMVFAHHPIWGIESQDEQRALKDALFAHGNVIGYFAGHTHSPQLRAIEEECEEKDVGGARAWVVLADPRRRCGRSARRMWEIVGPSTLEFPQQARQVTMVDVPGTGLAYFEILPFSPQLAGDGRSYVERALASAKRDHCREHPSSCIDGEPRQHEQYRSYSRLWFRVPAETGAAPDQRPAAAQADGS